MQIRRSVTPTATEADNKPAREKGAADARAATAMPTASNQLSMFSRLRREAPAAHAEASTAGRPRTPLNVLARVGLGLATLGLGATALTGCSSGTSGHAVGSAEPTTAPPSSGQSLDPAPTDSSTPSTDAADPGASTSAALPTSVPSLPAQPNWNVSVAQETFYGACEAEAYMITNQPRPTNDLLGPAYDQLSSVLNNGNAPGPELKKALDNYTLAAESAKQPEPLAVHLMRHEEMGAYVAYVQAQYNQTPTDELKAELQQAKETQNRADTTIPVATAGPQSSAQLPDWLSPG